MPWFKRGGIWIARDIDTDKLLGKAMACLYTARKWHVCRRLSNGFGTAPKEKKELNMARRAKPSVPYRYPVLGLEGGGTYLARR